MKRTLILAFSMLMLCSCGLVTPDLYYWGGESNGATTYEDLTYMDYKTQSPASLCSLLCAYQDIVVNSAAGSRKMPPPGVCAEYGYLLLQPKTATTFAENASDSQKAVFKDGYSAAAFAELGKAMFQKEVELYPESSQFITPLISKLAQ